MTNRVSVKSGGGDLGLGTIDQEQVHNPAAARQERSEGERQQLVGVRPEAQHLDPALVLPDRLPDAAGDGVRQLPRHRVHKHQEEKRQPVEVPGVDDSGKGGGDPLIGQAQSEVTAGYAE